MAFWNTDYWLRDYQAERREARRVDAPRRLSMLTPEKADYWVALLPQIAAAVERSETTRPCAYTPWVLAFSKVKGGEVKNPERYTWQEGVVPDGVGDFMSFLYDAAMPGWPEAHAHLVDFALAVLEADVTLFRSGYYKRHLLRRLRQASLDADQTARAEALIYRAVERGTGLEEFREIERLAARLRPEGLTNWLRERARDAYLTVDSFRSAEEYVALYAAFPDQRNKLSRHDRSYRPIWAFRADLTGDMVKRADLPEENMQRRNAWRVLRYMKMRGLV